MKDKIEVVAFDADDTLWENELYFQEFEHKFCDLLKTYQPPAAVSQELFKTEMKNLHMYGYGLKSMMLSMIETACRITGGKEKFCIAQKKLSDWDRNFCKKPVTLLDGVEDVLLQLQGKYKLVLATKGDLFDQKRKVMDSGLVRYFCHIEIMSDKKRPITKSLSQHSGMCSAEFPDVGKLHKIGHITDTEFRRIRCPYTLSHYLAIRKPRRERNSSQFPSIEKYQRYNRVSPIMKALPRLSKPLHCWNRLCGRANLNYIVFVLRTGRTSLRCNS